MDKIPYSFSELWFEAFLEAGRGQVKNPEKIFCQHQMFSVASTMLVKGFKLFHFGRPIFFLWSCEDKFASTSIKVTFLVLLLLTLKGTNLF